MFVAVPPLFRITTKKNEYIYLRDAEALEEYKICVYRVIDEAFDTILKNMTVIHKNNELENMNKLDVNGSCSEKETAFEKENLKNIKKSLKDIKRRVIKLS